MDRLFQGDYPRQAPLVRLCDKFPQDLVRPPGKVHPNRLGGNLREPPAARRRDLSPQKDTSGDSPGFGLQHRACAFSLYLHRTLLTAEL